MRFVLDASVTLSWLLRDAGTRDERYALAVLDTLRASDAAAQVPGIWGLEVANVLARCETKGLVTAAQRAAFLGLLDALRIEVDEGSALRAIPDVLPLARQHRLSSYDAAYLELALRHSLPLASFDEDLRRAASKAGVRLLKP